MHTANPFALHIFFPFPFFLFKKKQTSLLYHIPNHTDTHHRFAAPFSKMIKRRAFLFYTFVGLALLYFLYNINSAYSPDRYEIGYEEQRLQTPFQVPDPFPKGKPDFRKKKGEGDKEKEDSSKEEEQLKEQEEEQKAKELLDSSKEEDEKANNDAVAAASASEDTQAPSPSSPAASDSTDTQEKTGSEGSSSTESKKEEPKSDEKKEPKAEEKKEEPKAEEKKEEAEEEDDKDDNSGPLYDNYFASTGEGTAALSLKERIADRYKRYTEYMKMHAHLSAKKQKKESNKLQSRFLDMEHVELKTFESPVEYTSEDMVDGVVQPAPKKIVLLTASDGKGNTEIGGVLEAARENRKEYCAYHGYNEYFVNLTQYQRHGWHPVWSKMGAIRDAFETYPEAEWVWWLDTDAIIMNAELDLGRHILSKRALEQHLTYKRPLRNPEADFYNGAYMEKGEVDFDQIDMVISQDFFGLNAGSFFIRRSSFSEYLLEAWEDPLYEKQDFVRREQDALIHMFLNHERFQRHFGLVPQRILNSYYDDPKWVWAYQPGDLIVHFAGCNTKGKCESTFTEMWNKRTQVPEKYHVSDRIDLAKFFTNSDQEIKKEEKN